MKVAKSIKSPDLLTRGIGETIKMKQKFIDMWLGTLSFSLSENMLAGKNVIRAGEGTIKAKQDFYYPFIL